MITDRIFLDLSAVKSNFISVNPPVVFQMTFPQLNSGSRMAALAKKILQAATSEEAKKIFQSVKGSVLQSKLKRKLIEIESTSSSTPLNLNPKLSFLQAPIKSPIYTPPDPSKFLAHRLAKWQLISDNMAKMEDTILKEYRERRSEGKWKEKKNKYPF